MLFVFRLVFAPRRQGYTTTLAQLWAQCRALDVPLPQERPVSDTAMCKARPRIDEHVFQRFHAEILRRADQPGPLWLGHRVFAVDGSKLTLPRALLEAGYRIADLADLYHARWGIEEMYKISKQFLEVDQFHGQRERLVKQELYAHFNLIAMARLFTNRDAERCQAGRQPDGQPAPQANFKHSLAGLAQHLEGLLLRHAAYVSETLEHICAWIGTGRRKPRPNRSYVRALPAAGPEMVPPPQGRDRLGTSMPTPMPMH